MATVGNRAIAYVAAPHVAAAATGSNFITATIDFRTAEKFWIDFRGAQAGDVTSPPELDIYRSSDGGVSFESVAMSSTTFARVASADDRKVIELDGGFYALAMQAGGPNTATLGIETCEVLTGYVGV